MIIDTDQILKRLSRKRVDPNYERTVEQLTHTQAALEDCQTHVDVLNGQIAAARRTLVDMQQQLHEAQENALQVNLELSATNVQVLTRLRAILSRVAPGVELPEGDDPDVYWGLLIDAMVLQQEEAAKLPELVAEQARWQALAIMGASVHHFPPLPTTRASLWAWREMMGELISDLRLHDLGIEIDTPGMAGAIALSIGAIRAYPTWQIDWANRRIYDFIPSLQAVTAELDPMVVAAWAHRPNPGLIFEEVSLSPATWTIYGFDPQAILGAAKVLVDQVTIG